MTDLSQASSKPISVRRTVIILLVAALLGLFAGLAATRTTVASSQAIAVISIGKPNKDGFLEEPFSLIERIKSTGFATTVAARAAMPDLTTLLPARQYGGAGALEARTLREPTLIEIRVNLPRAEAAQKAVAAVMDQLLADHEMKERPLTDSVRSSLPLIEKGVSQLVESRDMITKRLGSLPQDGQTDQEIAALRSALALTETGLSSLVDSARALTVLAVDSRKTQIVAAPTVMTTSGGSFYRMTAAGTVVGLVIGFLLLQLFPSLFRARSAA
ncbi:hypothetical protein FXB41_13890 [Bradyrhizobium canariense]|uniref:hypothetical protein n=1 Tax=Bradyrhizobium canariense TaxID=255045 RepID=UPI001CA5AC35|nr:hypothetical protein [Bradyrhizobium canariense]MBW5435835.1 hypothetical protein [Bradyrhizobium canariense]